MRGRAMKSKRSCRRILLTRAVGLSAGFLADLVFADPSRFHPVAGYGLAAQKLIDTMYTDSKPRGVAFNLIAVGVPTAAACALSRRLPGTSLALATWASLGGTTLCRTGQRMAAQLESENLEGSRALVPWLCSRDPEALDLDGIARATVESLAENTSDAVSGTLWWGVVLGTPGVVAHRAINTLDAMVGYHSDRWRNFGWASARIDDVAGYIPSRLTAIATVIAGPNRRQAWRSWRNDASKHPSPNAGVVEASAAGALGLQLGGKTVYSSGVEMRPTMGQGRSPEVPDVRAATELSLRVQAIMLAQCLAGLGAVALVTAGAASAPLPVGER